MSTNNPWLTPYQRSFNSIKSQLISSLNKNAPEITDLSEGNIFIILISIFAAIAEVLHYYIDNMARETFFSTARRYTSLYKHAKLVDYHIKAAHPASTDIYLTTLDGSPLNLEGDENGLVLTAGAINFTDSQGNSWVLSRNVFWENGTYSVVIPVSQKEPVNSGNQVTIGQITDPNSVIYLPDIEDGKKYVEGSMVLTITYNGKSENWTLVDTFAYSGPDDMVYKVELDSNLKPYITFGDGLFGKRPNLNGTLKGKYWITLGSNGNIPENSFNELPSEITNKSSNIKISRSLAAGGGTDYEDFDMIKEHLPLSVKTLGVAITKDDYEAVIKNVPGVDKAYVNYKCGKIIEAYITPYGAAEASTDLINQVTNYLNSNKVITASITVNSTKEAIIFLNAEIWGRKSYKYTDIYNSVMEALIESYSKQNSSPNRPIRLSDIYALLDNLPMVDYLKLNSVLVVNPPSNGIDNRGDEIVNPISINYLSITYVDSNITSEYLTYIVYITRGVSVEGVYYLVYNPEGNIISDDTGQTYFSFDTLHSFVDTSTNYGYTVKFDMSLKLNYSEEGLYLPINNINVSASLNINTLTEVYPQNYCIPVFKQTSIFLNINEQV